MATQFCWLFQLLDNELVISEKCCFIHITARFPTGIASLQHLAGTCHDLFLWGSHISSSDTKEKDHPIHAGDGRLKKSLCFDPLCD